MLEPIEVRAMENQVETTWKMKRKLKGFGLGGLGYTLGLYKDDGKENGNYYLGFRVLCLRFKFWGLAFRV